YMRHTKGEHWFQERRWPTNMSARARALFELIRKNPIIEEDLDPSGKFNVEVLRGTGSMSLGDRKKFCVIGESDVRQGKLALIEREPTTSGRTPSLAEWMTWVHAQCCVDEKRSPLGGRYLPEFNGASQVGPAIYYSTR